MNIPDEKATKEFLGKFKPLIHDAGAEVGEAEFRKWIEEYPHKDFYVEQIVKALWEPEHGETKPRFRARLSVFLRAEKERETIAPLSTADLWRKLSHDSEPLDFYNATSKPLPIKIPLGIHDDLGVEVYEKDIIAVAGVSSHGKSAFMLAFADLNMREHDVWYFSSGDMSATRLRARMKSSGVPLDTWQEYLGGKTIEVYEPFDRCVKPDAINLCDFMHEGEKPWLIAEKMKAVKENLTTGIAVIALQKNRNAEYGLGGEKSEIFSNLYITIDSGVARIKKAKSFDETIGSPVGKQYQFKLISGFTFLPDKEGMGGWYDPNDLPPEFNFGK